jgi:hypothetical protein
VSLQPGGDGSPSGMRGLLFSMESSDISYFWEQMKYQGFLI